MFKEKCYESGLILMTEVFYLSIDWENWTVNRMRAIQSSLNPKPEGPILGVTLLFSLNAHSVLDRSAEDEK